MGSSKICIPDFRVSLAGSPKYFREYLCEKENIFKIIFGVLIWGLGTFDLCKNTVQKSHATVPFNTR